MLDPEDNQKRKFWLEMLSDEKEKQFSSTRFIAVGGAIIGWIVVLSIVVEMFLGKLPEDNLMFFTFVTSTLFAGAYGTKIHQNQKKK